ncbi:hypothetical protein LEP1GSC202_1653 [Leptospira yanagawae serovar Saopaulo str. Sao Paulo = ATCC 700523]|uniref:Uncharacterized protein n=1 Tax=Leptospira yanagawae serovar Saopaulo str. Sao Paulo = ATCC 700523 TaxID=1249483 RepID=A0A5E8HET2_9LEPT|nr:hypothetical protein [Leptospira yanagawae]EOQ89981.1 hypothetical protein LEP1GSC202_1653 [Leptospira yanagawae serovar Saopaulo str. Sao Paulo = ATCC 700523]
MKSLFLPKFFIYSFGFLIAFSLFAEEGTKLIAWKPIHDASGYQIQIKDKAGKIILDKKIDTPYHSIEELPSGMYMVRTAPLNLFKKPAVWSAWKDLEIIISEPPKVVKETDTPVILSKQESKSETTIKELTIEGEHFLEATNVDLSKKGDKLPIVSKEVKTSERIDLKVDTTEAKTGPYDLTVTNPYQKPKVVKNFVQVEEPKTYTQESKQTSKENLEEIKKNERVKSNTEVYRQNEEKVSDTSKNISGVKPSESNQSQKQITTPITPKQKVTLPKGKSFHDFTYDEMIVFLETDVAVNCKNTKIPAFTLGECHKTYVILNFASEDNQSVFEFYKLVSDNESNRISAYRYFSNNCNPIFKPALERMELQWKNRTNLDPEERQSLAVELPKFRACTR